MTEHQAPANHRQHYKNKGEKKTTDKDVSPRIEMPVKENIDKKKTKLYKKSCQTHLENELAFLNTTIMDTTIQHCHFICHQIHV